MKYFALIAVLITVAGSGFTVHRSFRNGYPAEWNVSKAEAEVMRPLGEQSVHFVWASVPGGVKRREFIPGKGPIEKRVAASVEDWPETGYWLSTLQGLRHNRKCEYYRRTRGYPCSRREGRPCRKCGG